METQLRALGMNVRLMNSQVELLENFVMCEEGKPISVRGSKVLVRYIHYVEITRY